jgi:hypothetical protein
MRVLVLKMRLGLSPTSHTNRALCQPPIMSKDSEGVNGQHKSPEFTVTCYWLPWAAITDKWCIEVVISTAPCTENQNSPCVHGRSQPMISTGHPRILRIITYLHTRVHVLGVLTLGGISVQFQFCFSRPLNILMLAPKYFNVEPL